MGTVILSSVTATDKDSGVEGTFYYELVTADSRFSIDRLTGKLRLAERLEIDPSNPTSTITITFGVYDNGTPQNSDTATVTITVTDSNDNPPVCVSYELSASILESATLPITTSAAVSCSDTEDSSATITYEIAKVNDIEYSQFVTQKLANFSFSGSNEVIVGGFLDFEEDSVYIVEILVLDTFAGSVQTASVTARITVSKDVTTEPSFLLASAMYQVEVAEDTPVDTEILDLESSLELSGTALIYLKTSNTETNFAVNPRNGKLYVSETLDRETVAEYNLTVEVVINSTDTLTGITGTATATVSVVVTDINDNPPTFNPKRYVTKVPETERVGFVLTSLTVSDADSGPNGEISTMSVVSGDPTGLFSLSQSFQVEVSKELDFDAVTFANYTLVIEAEDAGTPTQTGTATVYVEVLPVNEYAPVFGSSSYAFTMSESDVIGTFVGSIAATDADRPTESDGR